MDLTGFANHSQAAVDGEIDRWQQAVGSPYPLSTARSNTASTQSTVRSRENRSRT